MRELARLSIDGPHRGALLAAAGEELGRADRALVLLHGRGASAADILALGEAIAPRGTALVAPEAVGGQWYPHRFLAPLADNEPWLSSGLAALEAAVAFAHDHGIPDQRIALGGFSQGACLALEATARAPRGYLALLGLSGGRIGPPDLPFAERRDFAGLPVLLACDPRDPHIPWSRVEETAGFFTARGAAVTLLREEGLGHSVSHRAAAAARRLLAADRGALST